MITDFSLDKPLVFPYNTERNSDEGEKARRSCPKRAGGWCEPVEETRDTGSGAFRLRPMA